MSNQHNVSNTSISGSSHNTAGIPNLVPASGSSVSSTYSSVTGPRSITRSTTDLGGRNNRRNNNPFRGKSRNTNRNNTQQKGKIEEIQLLKHASEWPRKDQFVIFQFDTEQYIIKNFKNPADVVNIVKQIEDLTPKLMKNIPKKSSIKSDFGDVSSLSDKEKKDIDDAVDELHTQSMKLFAVRRQQLKENITKIYGIIWGNCTHLLQNQITSHTDYENKSQSFDAVWLMEQVKLAAQGIDNKQDIYHSTFVAVRGLYGLKQQQNETLESYYCCFKLAANTADMLKANSFLHPGICEVEPKGTRSDTQYANDCREGYKVMMFLMNADTRTYSKLWKRMSESVTLGTNQYPRTLTAAFEILSKCKPDASKLYQNQNSPNNNSSNIVGATFTQAIDTVNTNPRNQSIPEPPANNGTNFLQTANDIVDTSISQ